MTHVRARNLEPHSANPIHGDDVARRYGYRGGLVPGVIVYAYLTRLPATAWGRPWLERGTMTLSLLRPVYDGDDLTLSGPDALRATGPLGHVCAEGAATLPAAPAAPPALDRYPLAPLPASRAPATPEALASLDVLGSLSWGFHADRAAAYLDAIDDDVDVYRRDAIAHPGWLIQWANWVFAANVVLGPWIHVSSAVTHHRAVTDGERLSMRGRVAALYEKSGHRFVELDLLAVAGDDSPVMHIDHTAIYQIREPR